LDASTHDNRERLSRQQAAEHLTDVAYALMTGGRLTLSRDRRITVPIADELTLRRIGTATGDQVKLELELIWSTAKPAP